MSNDETRADPAGESETQAAAQPLPDHPLNIAHYRVLRLLGQGGMGEVFEAEQLEPVRRRVAVKLVKLGMDTREVVARFESERQALAMMNHPAIARVFDAGATELGRPYFAMELVQGVPILNYCDTHRLGIRERLRLYLDVVAGVQHAHQKGVIHRDLKPSNVLVGVEGDRPSPKIIDFGVAKATAQRLSAETLYTELGQLIGTPDYMSPEQAEMSALDVDTRSDIYSLGVMLYELIAGARPFDSQSVRQSGIDELRRRIREDTPLRPSARLVALGPTRGQLVAQERGCDLATLVKQLRGDLDWITLKAMEKDRTRRYGSASELIAEITRHLRNEPVLASPPSTTYRMAKFVKRHSVGVTAAALMTVTLLIGTTAATIGMVRARRAEAATRQEAETARQVSEFLVDLFEVSDPFEGAGDAVTARELLDEGAAAIGRKLEDQPRVQARLMGTIGEVYESLGLYDQARPHIEKALQIQQQVLPRDDLDLAATMNQYAVLLWDLGEYEQALPLAQQALTVREQLLGPDDPAVARTLGLLANLYWDTGRRDQVQALHERALAIMEHARGAEHPDVVASVNNLGAFHMRSGDYARARQLYERALKIRSAEYGSEHPKVASSLNNLAGLLTLSGDYDAAMPLYHRALEIQEQALGPDHPRVAITLNNIAGLLSRTGRLEEARRDYDRALAIKERALGPDHLSVAKGLNSLGFLLLRLGDHAAARPLFERALAIREQALGADDPEVATSLNNLGDLLAATGDSAGARRYLERALAIRRAALPADHPHLAFNLQSLGELLARTGEADAARACFEEALQIRRSKLGADHPLATETTQSLARLDEQR